MDVERLTFRDLDRIAHERGELGKVAVAEQGKGRLAPWQEGSLRRSGWSKAHRREQVVPEQMVAQMMNGLPPVVRRTPRERYRVLIERLVADGLASYRKLGYVVWPRSIAEELKVLGWKEGDPNFYGQVESLARKFIEEGANKQRAKDAAKVTNDWHGHYTA